MSIDFSQVKTITIPEGSVTKITDSTGNILWQSGGQSEGWHTIWEGNKTITLTKSGTNAPEFSGQVVNLAQTAIGTGTTPKLRITFSYSITENDPNWSSGFYINDGPLEPESHVSSPVDIGSLAKLGSNICSVGCKYNSDSNIILSIGLRKKFSWGGNTNNNITINLTWFKGNNNADSTSGDFTLTFTVTKIEQYY